MFRRDRFPDDLLVQLRRLPCGRCPATIPSNDAGPTNTDDDGRTNDVLQ